MTPMSLRLRAFAGFMFVGAVIAPSVMLRACAEPASPSVGPAIICAQSRCNPEAVSFLISGSAGNVEARILCRTSTSVQWAAVVDSGVRSYGATDSMHPHVLTLTCPRDEPHEWRGSDTIWSWG